MSSPGFFFPSSPFSSYITLTGSFYLGPLNACHQPSGQGFFIFSDGSIMNGIFFEGLANGLCLFKAREGLTIIGNFSKGILNGNSILFNSEQNKYFECLFEAGEMVWKGEIKVGVPTELPIGCGKFEDFTKMLEKSGEQNEKKFVYRVFADGGWYIGAIKEIKENKNMVINKKDELGEKAIIMDPEETEGEGLQDREGIIQIPNGLGVFIFPDGKMHKGLYTNGIPNGPNIIEFESGDYSIGFLDSGEWKCQQIIKNKEIPTNILEFETLIKEIFLAQIKELNLENLSASDFPNHVVKDFWTLNKTLWTVCPKQSSSALLKQDYPINYYQQERSKSHSNSIPKIRISLAHLVKKKKTSQNFSQGKDTELFTNSEQNGSENLSATQNSAVLKKKDSKLKKGLLIILGNKSDKSRRLTGEEDIKRDRQENDERISYSATIPSKMFKKNNKQTKLVDSNLNNSQPDKVKIGNNETSVIPLKVENEEDLMAFTPAFLHGNKEDWGLLRGDKGEDFTKKTATKMGKGDMLSTKTLEREKTTPSKSIEKLEKANQSTNKKSRASYSENKTTEKKSKSSFHSPPSHINPSYIHPNPLNIHRKYTATTQTPSKNQAQNPDILKARAECSPKTPSPKNNIQLKSNNNEASFSPNNFYENSLFPNIKIDDNPSVSLNILRKLNVEKPQIHEKISNNFKPIAFESNGLGIDEEIEKLLEEAIDLEDELGLGKSGISLMKKSKVSNENILKELQRKEGINFKILEKQYEDLEELYLNNGILNNSSSSKGGKYLMDLIVKRFKNELALRFPSLNHDQPAFLYQKFILFNERDPIYIRIPLN